MKASTALELGILIILTVWASFWGYQTGKADADAWYAAHPVMVECRPERIITEPGDRICPKGDACEWQAFDVTTGKPVNP